MKRAERTERARKILQTINCRITDLMVLPNDEIMTNKLFRLMLKEHEDMKERFDILEKRKFKIKRFIFENA